MADETPQAPDGCDTNEAARAIADRLASLGTLVAGVAHEINNPITYVLGNLGDLERLAEAMREYVKASSGEPGDPLAAAAALAKIEQAGGLELLDELVGDVYEGALRIRDLVRDLLNLARPQAVETEPVNVHEILDSTLRMASRQISAVATLEVEYGATRLVVGDRARLAGAFLNLITNAVHACGSSRLDAPSLRVSTRDTGDGVEIDVADTGLGIGPEARERVFTPFYTTKAPGEGTGLGLHISRRIVEEHGGTLDFRDREGGGTIFSVRLPAQPE